MIRRSYVWVPLLLILGVAAPGHAGQPDQESDRQPLAFETAVKPFLMSYCSGCHGEEKQKGDRRFDRLKGQIADDNTLVDFQDILDQLNLGEMPPRKARQPSTSDRKRVIDWLTANINRYHQAHQGLNGQTILRRLNAREYRNTVRDLLSLNMTMFDPAQHFPRDQLTEHLDNVGDELVTSGHLLAAYLMAAEQVVDKAMTPLTQPKVQSWEFHDGFDQQPEIDQVHRRTNKFAHLTLYDVIGADKHEGAYAPIHAFKKGVPHDGIYEIRFQAEALNRQHPYDPAFLGTDPSEPLRLGIVAGNYRAGRLHKPQPIEPLLAEVELDDAKKWYTARVWLDAGFTPRFTFQNGLMDARNLWGRLLQQYKDQFPKRTRPGIVEARFNAIKYGKLPQIHIHDVEISGPYYEAWPQPSQRALLGEDWLRAAGGDPLSDEGIRRHLQTFMSRAYRRPVREEEVERILTVIKARQQAGRSPIQAYGDGLKTVLCSPHFLYLDEGDQSQLSGYGLATRLAYFLWSSMPDPELLELAASGELKQPRVLAAQVERMLDDPKSDAFLSGFLDSWLTLRDLGSSPPDRQAFPEYYHYDLMPAMRRETHLFTRRLLDENLSIKNFLDADFTYVNRPLARMYGIEPPAGSGFELVTLADPRRGGLLGQASILTVTANGIDTSPVVRGVWLLENILGTPPSPPPPDVEPLDPDIRGAKTIRDQLRKHRSVASCNDCHRKIDPLGFALENFDPIGNWRENYGRNQSIDASGEMPDGHAFEDVVGLKQILAGQQDQFALALTRKLLAYATGRHVRPADRPHIDRMLGRLREDSYGFRDLVVSVVLSEPFKSK